MKHRFDIEKVGGIYKVEYRRIYWDFYGIISFAKFIVNWDTDKEHLQENIDNAIHLQ